MQGSRPAQARKNEQILADQPVAIGAESAREIPGHAVGLRATDSEFCDLPHAEVSGLFRSLIASYAASPEQFNGLLLPDEGALYIRLL